MRIPEGGKMQISPKLELYHANQDQIRNQRPRLHKNIQFLGRKTGGCKVVPKTQLKKQTKINCQNIIYNIIFILSLLIQHFQLKCY